MKKSNFNEGDYFAPESGGYFKLEFAVRIIGYHPNKFARTLKKGFLKEALL